MQTSMLLKSAFSIYFKMFSCIVWHSFYNAML